MTSTKSQRAMRIAHLLRSEKPDFAWSDLLRHAWYFIRFRSWLQSGVVTFTYIKRDDTLREARGTLHPLLIPEDDRPKGTAPAAKPNYALLTYYDLNRKAWREFDIRRFVGFVDRLILTAPAKSAKEKRSKRENYAACND